MWYYKVSQDAYRYGNSLGVEKKLFLQGEFFFILRQPGVAGHKGDCSIVAKLLLYPGACIGYNNVAQ